MHVRKTYEVKGHIYVRSYSAHQYGAPLKERAKKIKETPRAMRDYNNQKRAEKIQLLILNNFDKGFHVILDYPIDQKPETYEIAEDNLKKALYKTSRRLKKKGIPFKYLGVTERGKRAAALHHHLIIEGQSQILEELLDVWGRHLKAMPMYEEGSYEDLAKYLVKVETKEEQKSGKSKYHRSRNLKDPIERTEIRKGPIKQDPEIPEGYEMVEHSLVNGFNEIVGVRYQKYLLRESGERIRPHPKEPKGSRLIGMIKRIFGGRKR